MIRAKKGAAIFLSAVMLTAYTPGIVHAQDQTTPKKAEAVKTVDKAEGKEPASPSDTPTKEESVGATDNAASDVVKSNSENPEKTTDDKVKEAFLDLSLDLNFEGSRNESNKKFCTNGNDDCDFNIISTVY